MLAAKHRIRKKKDFEEIKEKGNLYQRDLFGVVVLKKEKSLDSRFGFVVSTKISKHASQRNRIKRALREAVRHHLYIVEKGYDIIFLPKTNILRKSTDEMMREVKLFILGEIDKGRLNQK